MSLTEQLERLAAFEPTRYPVVSLYLNTQAGQHGREEHTGFVRKEFKARARTYPASSPQRESLERDLLSISSFLEEGLQPSTSAVAIFACSGCGLFETLQLGALIDRHSLYVGDRAHLYPLARIHSQRPAYAALLVDSHTARILVFATGELVSTREVNGIKTRRTSEGGMSQARFQRHVGNLHLHHAKEVVDALDRIVRQEGISQVVVAGDEVITSLLREQMPKSLTDKIVDHVRLDAHAPVDEVVKVSLDAMRRANERTDRERVDAAVGAYRAGGLGVVGAEETLAALVKGQVDDLLISASLRDLKNVPVEIASDDGRGSGPSVASTAAGESAEAEPGVVRLADDLVTKATQTAARITFIEDPALLASYGGVAALLRFRI